MFRSIFFATLFIKTSLCATTMVYETLPDGIKEVDVIIAGGMYFRNEISRPTFSEARLYQSIDWRADNPQVVQLAVW